MTDWAPWSSVMHGYKRNSTPNTRFDVHSGSMRQQPAKHVWWRVVWAVLIVLVVLGSLLPADSVIMEKLDALPVNDKVQHFAAYAALAFCADLARVRYQTRNFLGLRGRIGCPAGIWPTLFARSFVRCQRHASRRHRGLGGFFHRPAVAGLAALITASTCSSSMAPRPCELRSKKFSVTMSFKQPKDLRGRKELWPRHAPPGLVN